MSSSDDYIIITESHDLDEGSLPHEAEINEEGDDVSLRILEKQGVSILKNNDFPASDEPRDQFSRELMDEGGIEIVSSDEEESYL